MICHTELVPKVEGLRVVKLELPAFYPGGAKLVGYMDIANLGNMLNNKWGTIQQIGFPYTSANIDATIVGNQYSYNSIRRGWERSSAN